MKYFEILILSIVFLLSVNTFAQDQNSVTAQVTPGTNHVPKLLTRFYHLSNKRCRNW